MTTNQSQDKTIASSKGLLPREELLVRSVVEIAGRTSSVDAFDQGRIRRVIRFSNPTVGETMIPIAEVTAIKK